MKTARRGAVADMTPTNVRVDMTPTNVRVNMTPTNLRVSTTSPRKRPGTTPAASPSKRSATVQESEEWFTPPQQNKGKDKAVNKMTDSPSPSMDSATFGLNFLPEFEMGVQREVIDMTIQPNEWESMSVSNDTISLGSDMEELSALRQDKGKRRADAAMLTPVTQLSRWASPNNTIRSEEIGTRQRDKGKGKAVDMADGRDQSPVSDSTLSHIDVYLGREVRNHVDVREREVRNRVNVQEREVRRVDVREREVSNASDSQVGSRTSSNSWFQLHQSETVQSSAETEEEGT